MQRTNTTFTPFICFSYNKLGHKAIKCPDKKTLMPTQAPGSVSKLAPPPHTTDRGRLTHLIEKGARNAPSFMNSEYPIDNFKLQI